MRLAASLRTIPALAFLALALFAIYSPASFAAHGRAADSGLFLALSLITSAAAARLTLALPPFGPHVSFTLPLFAAVAAPYFARFALRRLGGLSGAEGENAQIAPPRPRPYNLPSRVSAALEAAARARITAGVEHCPGGRAPL